MSYLDRLRECTYKAPSGASFVLQFDDLERSAQKKAAVHEFPLLDEADVQDLGNGTIRFPLAVYISGADYDRTADQFWDALSERGPGSLAHPRFGDLRVLPVSWTQAERFVEGMGRAEFKIEFIHSPEVEFYQRGTLNVDAGIASALNAADSSGAAAFGRNFNPANAAEKAASKNRFLRLVEDINEKTQSIVQGSQSLASQVNAQVRSFEANIDALMESPVALANALSSVARLPATAAGSISAKIRAYKGILENAVSSIPRSYSEIVGFIQGLFAVGAGSIQAALSGDSGGLEPAEEPVLGAASAEESAPAGGASTAELRSREEAIFSAQTLTEIIDLLQNSIEAAEIVTYEVASGESPPDGRLVISAETFSAPQEVMDALKKSAAAAAQNLLEKAYALAAERRITLNADRTPIELVAEFYGDLDRLEEFIQSNALQGSELFIVPAGREVVYYG